MGDVHCRILASVQYFNLFLTAIAYNITGATSMQNVALTYCNADGTGCYTKYWTFCIIFGGVQLVLSQLPNLDSLWWVSALGMIASFCYSFIALGLAISHGDVGGGDLAGAPYDSSSDKMFAVFNAIGAIVFAYSFSFILVEIADTMKGTGKGPVSKIKRSVNWAMVIITGFYIAVSVSGYAAFGNNVCGNIITCFTEPVGLIRATNIFVLIHMFPGTRRRVQRGAREAGGGWAVGAGGGTAPATARAPAGGRARDFLMQSRCRAMAPVLSNESPCRRPIHPPDASPPPQHTQTHPTIVQRTRCSRSPYSTSWGGTSRASKTCPAGWRRWPSAWPSAPCTSCSSRSSPSACPSSPTSSA